MSLDQEEKEFISQVCAEDNAARKRRNPQRPVVLPERMYSLLPGADYWNACLDEFKRLNP